MLSAFGLFFKNWCRISHVALVSIFIRRGYAVLLFEMTATAAGQQLPALWVVTGQLEGALTMDRISRRQIVRGAAATAVATTFGSPSVHAQKDGQALRFVPHAELKILDPVWTIGYITQNHGYLVYDT
jgi:hypothetical protein